MELYLKEMLGAKMIFLTRPDSKDALIEIWQFACFPYLPIHKHPCQEENLEIVEGKVQIWLNEKWNVLEKGQELVIPADTFHTFRNNYNKEAILISGLNPVLNFREIMQQILPLEKQFNISRQEKTRKLIELLQAFKKDFSISYTPPFGRSDLQENIDYSWER